MSHRVEIAETQQVFMVAPGESVLDAALRCGVSLAHECTFGGCGTCRVRVVDGAVTYEEFPMGLTEEEDAAGFALACQARPAGDLVISTARAAEPAIPARRTTATVQAITSLGPDVLHLRLALSDDEAFAFEPGQYLKILLEDGSHRSFSMASAPNGNTVDFHVRQIAGGRFTAGQLPQLRPGDKLDVEVPHGSFSLRKEDYRPLLMVATGTGLAPIKSMLEALMDDPDCPPVWLYWGCARQRISISMTRLPDGASGSTISSTCRCCHARTMRGRVGVAMCTTRWRPISATCPNTRSICAALRT
jgi:CDP-4-dehydro-6-deoxyglucose reductase